MRDDDRRDAAARAAVDPGRYRGHHFYFFRRHPGTEGNWPGRRGMAGVELDDGVRVSADFHELSATSAHPAATLEAEPPGPAYGVPPADRWAGKAAGYS